jgi:hypothetical protein
MNYEFEIRGKVLKKYFYIRDVHRGAAAAGFFKEPPRRGSGSFSAAMDISVLYT